MSEYKAFNLRVGLSESTDIRQRAIDDFLRMASNAIQPNPSLKNNVLVNGISKDIVVINTDFLNEKVVHSLGKENSFKLGDLVQYKNHHWLVIGEDLSDDVYLTGRIKQCNYPLRWQNRETFQIIERWCVVENPYSSGLEETKVVTVGGNQFRIKLQYDDESRLLHLDQRFLIGSSNNKPVAYKIVRYDDITNTSENNDSGFITIYVEQDLLKDVDDVHNDNFDLGIADYIEPPSPLSDTIGLCEIVYTGEAVVRIGGNSKTFKVLLKDDENNPIVADNFEWEIVPSELVDNGHIAIVYQSNNEIKVEAKSNVEEDTTFVLRYKANDNINGDFMCEERVLIRGLF